MKKISDSTISRLSTYYRTLSHLIDQGIETVSSEQIAEINNITSAQVRKDLSFFGSFGKRGLGYNTRDLRDQIANILGLSKKWNVALVGVGNIGRALIDYAEFKKQGFHIKALFDNDPKKVGQEIGGLKIHHMDSVCNVVKEEKIEIAIIAVPAKVAQSVVDSLVKCGVKAFLNFAPITIKAPDDVMVKNENMSIELEALSYFLTQNEKGD
ncbi:Redox-sensing transcriptional repressor rex [Caldithrix abyssi DSM 13497]|uniref:Redox-sensing transcriptional repressor Rex n=1 Tax=Caldithrix abyssi DSM 13497 TaxID=880073 RepID=H1XV70_CALAY|nr:redox-sensing transcriptional repressor Rex [Caldithrix abyssi]APF16758.1 rex redox-sensing transcriptional repressor [Caldithrix abyssi DSM 13497]EHO40576.1 Redox-sensing transcriptional repressor rex [Caldithrix abyssi DSM 13497]